MKPSNNIVNILNTGLLSTNDRILVACSGGLDSSVLVYALSIIKDEFNLSIVLCHLNHNLRGKESDRDERFVKSLAKKYGCAFYSKKLTKNELKGVAGDSLQDFLRTKRYDYFSEVCEKQKLDKIVTAHNSDDVVETFLMRLLKGTSLKGLTSIKPKRGNVVRPLIDVSRKEIERYGKQNKIKFVEDSSNKSQKYLRNSVRLNLVPYIEENFNVSFKETVLRTVSNLAADDDFVSEHTSRLKKRALLKSKPYEVVFHRKKLLYAHKALKLRLFFQTCADLCVNANVTTRHGLSFIELLKGSEGTKVITLPSGLKVVRAYDKISFVLEGPSLSEKPFIENIKIPGSFSFYDEGFTLDFKVLNTRPKNLKSCGLDTAFFDYGKFAKNVTLRYFKDGDTIKPLGMDGTKKIKDIFIDEKVSLLERKRVPLLCSGSKVAWIAGLKLSNEFKVTDKTTRFLKVVYTRLD